MMSLLTNRLNWEASFERSSEWWIIEVIMCKGELSIWYCSRRLHKRNISIYLSDNWVRPFNCQIIFPPFLRIHAGFIIGKHCVHSLCISCISVGLFWRKLIVSIFEHLGCVWHLFGSQCGWVTNVLFHRKGKIRSAFSILFFLSWEHSKLLIKWGSYFRLHRYI